MKLLVIGSGGREHALVWKLAQSEHARRIWCAPGNAGIAEERCQRTGAVVECVPVGAEDLEGLKAFASETRPDLTVVGPDNPLALGVVDELQGLGLKVWGPTKEAARIEWSKSFSQSFMMTHKIPTAEASSFWDPDSAKRFARRLDGRCAVKADGLALGKGVTICHSVGEADDAIDAMLVGRAFGQSSSSIVIQELLEGPELTLHAFCDGSTSRLFPVSQDHKRVGDGDRGPNTGGMGAYSPTPFLSQQDMAQVQRSVLDPWLAGCRAEGVDFRGILYPGIIFTEDGPKVFEFNARFGDPEAQIYLPMLRTDLLEVLIACVEGSLASVELEWSPEFHVCVIMASRGYPDPDSYEVGKAVVGLEDVKALDNTKVFHSATIEENGDCLSNGGRVLGVTAWRHTLQEATEAAYAAVDRIRFDGCFCRRDIAAKGLAAIQSAESGK